MTDLGDVMNAINVLKPYKALGMWVFDDANAGLHQEPFVGGADSIIDTWVEGFQTPDTGFRMTFSGDRFPGYKYTLHWRRAELSGNVYYCEELGAEGWLCPALLKYFESPPGNIYVRCDEIH